MPYQDEFARFLRRRDVLNERLDSTRADVDDWIAKNSETEPETAQLALLEGLLAARSDIYAQLKELDDRLVDYLLELMQHRPDSAKEPV